MCYVVFNIREVQTLFGWHKYMVKEYANARKAHSIQDIIGRPATEDYIEYVEKRLNPNCLIMKRDILRAKNIKGKTWDP